MSIKGNDFQKVNLTPNISFYQSFDFSYFATVLIELQVIAVHCGINNVPGDSAEDLLQKFQRLYDEIKELNPA